MKKVLYMLLFFLIAIIGMSKVFAASNVSIEKIELDKTVGNAKEKSKPTFDGLVMNYDVTFKNKGDSIKYKVLIKNNSEKEYKISNDTTFSEKQNIKYEYEVSDILKANSSVEFYVTVSYDKEVEEDQFVNGVFSDENVAVVKLLAEDIKSNTATEEEPIPQNQAEQEEDNPKTNSQTIIFAILTLSIVIALVSFVLLFKDKGKGIAGLVISICCIPIVTKALEELKVTTNVKVEILKGYRVYYTYYAYTYVNEDEIDNMSNKGWSCYRDENIKYFVGSISEANRIYQCMIQPTDRDPNIYYAGDEVTVSVINYTGKYCAFKEKPIENTINYLCNDELVDREFPVSSWMYTTHDEGEKEIMNFTSVDGSYVSEWIESNVYVSARTKFIMPAHDVYFGIEPA